MIIEDIIQTLLYSYNNTIITIIITTAINLAIILLRCLRELKRSASIQCPFVVDVHGEDDVGPASSHLT